MRNNRPDQRAFQEPWNQDHRNADRGNGRSNEHSHANPMNVSIGEVPQSGNEDA